ncbi:hypothetical protein [Pontibacter kalidii]|uniref:hypothetical protein n=1 Tax=Pontibacter kalidii TaxID=2592049 RepID=UPI00225430E5|nr:hypothetical protein [Pontibacter kalidii]
MKRRGLRRYFRNLKNQTLPEFIDFSGSEQSWFDFFHLHIDNIGLGNRSWKARKQHLDALFDLAGMVETKLQHYPKDYQYWIEIDEKDSVEDAIYIHTQNPNGSTFPFRLNFDNEAEVRNPVLLEYLKIKEYQIEKKKLIDADGKIGITYFLYKGGIGTQIK